MTPAEIRANAARRRAEERKKRESEPQATSTPDGRSVAPGTSREDAARIPEGMVYDPKTGGYVDTALVAERMGPAQGASATFLSGLPFVGKFFDEGMGQLDSAVTGRSPEVGQEITRQAQEQFAESNPKTSLGLQIAGGVAGSLPMAGVAGPAAGFVARGGNAVTQTARAATLGAGAGAVEGAVSGYGAGRGNRRGDSALVGGAVGAGMGAAVAALAPAVGAGASAIAGRIKKLDVRAIMDEFGVSAPAARMVREALDNDDLDAAAARLGQLGDDAMLADAGPATGALIDAASKTGGKALKVTRQAAETRSDEIGTRLPARLNAILGQPRGTNEAAREIADRTAPARKAAYGRAYSRPVPYGEQSGMKVEGVLSRIPPKTLKSAIDEANEAMTEAGTENLQIMARIADDGSVTFSQPLNVQQLDEVKKALDNIGKEAVDQFGRPTAQGNRARRLARDLRNAVGEAVPEYRAALKVGGDKIQQDEALDMGRKLLFQNTTIEDVRDFMSAGLSDDARDMLRQGLRNTIESSMARVRRTISDPNVDAREAMQLVKELSSRENITKVKLALGDAKAKALIDELDRAANALIFRGAVARNSDTAIRTAIQSKGREEVAPGLLRRILGKGGNPLEGARELTESLVGIDPRSLSEAEKRLWTEIAESLTSIKGDDARRALDTVRRAMAGQPMREQEARQVARAVATGFSLGAYQTGQQSLAQR